MSFGSDQQAQSSVSSGVAVVLSSSFMGYYAHLGFLQALADLEIYPEQLSGASGGALVAVMKGAGWETERCFEFFRSWGWKWAYFGPGILWRFPGVMTGTLGTGFLKTEKVIKKLRHALGEIRLENMRSPKVQVSVTNLYPSRLEMKDQGDAAEWAVASAAVPGLIRAHRNQDGIYWDGGLGDSSPMMHWLEDSSIHTIYIHKIDHRDHGQWPKPVNLGWSLSLVHQSIENELFDYRLMKMRDSGKNVHVLTTQTPHPGIWQSEKKARDLMELGRQTVIQSSNVNSLPQDLPSSATGEKMEVNAKNMTGEETKLVRNHH